MAGIDIPHRGVKWEGNFQEIVASFSNRRALPFLTCSWLRRHEQSTGTKRSFETFLKRSASIPYLYAVPLPSPTLRPFDKRSVKPTHPINSDRKIGANFIDPYL